MTIELNSKQVTEALAEIACGATPSGLLGLVRDALYRTEALLVDKGRNDAIIVAALADRIAHLATDLRRRESAAFAATPDDGNFNIAMAASVRECF